MIRPFSPRLIGAAFGLAVAASLLLTPASARQKDEPGAAVENAIGMKLRLIPAGKVTTRTVDEDFILSAATDAKRKEIDIPNEFYLGVYEVTQGEYEKVMGKNPSGFSPTGDNAHRVKGLPTARLPVENVTLADAKAFCDKLSAHEVEAKAKRVYRLPTGDEWEYAARAGEKELKLFAFGDVLSASQANYNGEVPMPKTAPGKNLQRPEVVGSYPANRWGLYDMHGNVWEWTSNEFRDKDDRVVEGRRMLRGGSWLNRARDCAVTTRLGLRADAVYNNVGFRVVCEVKK